MQATKTQLDARVVRLERTVRGLLLLIVAGLAFVVLSAASGPNVLSAGAFQLVDEEGAVLGEFAIADGLPVLHLKDESGVDRVSLFHNSEGSGLYVADADSVTRIGVAQFAHGGGGVALHGPESKGAAVLYLKGAGSLRFFDSEGTVTNQVLAEPSGDTP